ncbi:MAG: quinol:cytochrome C oxidoreductase [Acidobacteria bacterium]|nr:MAG: quinol:cytochrome C oxidoreductase [Acidobacteriota bacterium]
MLKKNCSLNKRQHSASLDERRHPAGIKDRRLPAGIALFLLILFTFACRQEMYDQKKYKPLASSNLFDDGGSSRQLIQGTVSRSEDHNATQTQQFPAPVTAAVMERGKERFNIYCTPCHDYLGTGNGMIVQRGFRPPPSFHIDRLRQAPVSHFYDVMTNGFGAMPSYADKVSPSDRWAIIAYIRALQFSQNAPASLLAEQDKKQLESITK